MVKLLQAAWGLGAFACSAAVVLVSVDWLTADAIRQRAREDLEASLTQVLPSQLYDNDLLADTVTVPGDDGGPTVTVYRARASGRITGVGFQVSGTGYGGPIRLVLGIDPGGRLLGVRVIAHSETPGLGDGIDAAKGDWIAGFTGRALGDPPLEGWAVRKDGGTFDQLSGATITPRAVIAAVRDGLRFFAAHRSAMLAPAADAGTAAALEAGKEA